MAGKESLLSPGFRSAAAMAGWDEETLLFATLVVEDTPVRESRVKKRPPGSNSQSRKRKSRRGPAVSVPPLDISLIDESAEVKEAVVRTEGENESASGKQGSPSMTSSTTNNGIKETMVPAEGKSEPASGKQEPPPEAPLLSKNGVKEVMVPAEGGNKPASGKQEAPSAASVASNNGVKEAMLPAEGENELVSGKQESPSDTSLTSNNGVPCIDRLREELSCAVCLEICFEPSTTPCGHSFCMKCLQRAADKCGKRCPKCRQLLSNARFCTVNTVLWNTIQLLFPDEVAATRKTAMSPVDRHDRSRRGLASRRSPARANSVSIGRNSFIPASQMISSSRRQYPEQDDMALAYRLQREEFIAAFEDDGQQQPSGRYRARAALRAMASAGVLHRRRRPV